MHSVLFAGLSIIYLSIFFVLCSISIAIKIRVYNVKGILDLIKLIIPSIIVHLFWPLIIPILVISYVKNKRRENRVREEITDELVELLSPSSNLEPLHIRNIIYSRITTAGRKYVQHMTSPIGTISVTRMDHSTLVIDRERVRTIARSLGAERAVNLESGEEIFRDDSTTNS